MAQSGCKLAKEKPPTRLGANGLMLMVSLVHLYCMQLAHYVNCSAYGLLQLRFLLYSW